MVSGDTGVRKNAERPMTSAKGAFSGDEKKKRLKAEEKKGRQVLGARSKEGLLALWKDRAWRVQKERAQRGTTGISSRGICFQCVVFWRLWGIVK